MRRQGLMGSLRPEWNRDPRFGTPSPELNGNPRFRKPLLYPFELRERASRKNTPAAANGKPMPLRGMTNS